MLIKSFFFSLLIVLVMALPADSKNDINLGQIFAKKDIPYKFIGTISDENLKLNVHVFEFPKAVDGKVFVGVLKDVNITVFYYFHPNKLNISEVVKNFGKNYQRENNTLIYKETNMFFEFDRGGNVINVGRFIEMTDL